MPVTPSAIARGAAVSGTNTAIATGTGSPTIITNIAVSNSGTTGSAFTLSLGGTTLLGAVVVPANSTAFFDLKQVITSGTVISGFGSTGNLNYHISGVNIS